jgi:hypothetical protein
MEKRFCHSAEKISTLFTFFTFPIRQQTTLQEKYNRKTQLQASQQ